MDFKLKIPFILASQSPRRKEILEQVGLLFQVEVPSEFTEWTASQIQNPAQLAWENAQGKAKALAHKHPKAWILGVDTVVDIEGEVLGKPLNPKDAFRMLSLLNGKTHTVWTAMHLINTETHEEKKSIDSTRVTFAKLDDEVLREYIQTGEPMDKAGAYAVQGIGALFIQKIEGDFFNVMGLSIRRLYELLQEA